MTSEMTHDFMSQCFEYNEGDGYLTWKHRPLGHFRTTRGWRYFTTRFAGKRAGKVQQEYMIVRMGRHQYREHRIIWALANGIDLSQVPDEIDHIDLNKSNNRLSNLRPATRAQNAMNVGLRVTNTSGVKGVSWSKSHSKWYAYINVNYKMRSLGLYDTIEQASEARLAAQHLHGEYARMTANDNVSQQEAAA